MDKNLSYTLRLKDLFSEKLRNASKGVSVLDKDTSKLSNTMSRLGNVFGGYLAVSGIRSSISSIVDATTKMQGFNNAIMASSRSEGMGFANLMFLNKQVDRLGLNLDAAQKGYKTFTGAVMGSSIEGATANNIFRQVSEASTILGLSAEQTEGSFLALGQMMSKGTVSAEELRGQLAERIPGAFQIGARAMGMTTKQLGEAMQKGLINSAEFLEKFGNELEKTFGAKLSNATSSLQSNLNRMDSSWERLKANIGNSQTGILSDTTSWAAGMVNKLNEIFEAANRMDSAFTNAKVSGFTKMQSFNNWLFAGSTNDFINNNFTGGKGKAEMLDRSVQSMYVEPAHRDKSSALDSEAKLNHMKVSMGKAFVNKEVGKLEYDRSMAIYEAALKQVKTTVSSFGSTGKSTSPMLTASGAKGGKGGASSSLGSVTEVTGNRPQSLTININKLVEALNVNTTNVNEGSAKIKEMVSKALLEAVNDVNQMER